MWNLSDVYKLCIFLVLKVLLCEAGKGSLQSEPEPEEADLLVQYGMSGFIPEPESEPGHQAYQGQGYYGQYGNYNHGDQTTPVSNPYWNYPYWNNYYQPGNCYEFLVKQNKIHTHFLAGGKPEPQSTGVNSWKQKQTYPEPEPTTGGNSWNQKRTYPEPEPTFTQQMYPVNQNAPSWVSTIIGFMNALRAELLTKINQCCQKNYGKNNILTMRKFRENIGTPKKPKMSYGQDYSDDGDYERGTYGNEVDNTDDDDDDADDEHTEYDDGNADADDYK